MTRRIIDSTPRRDLQELSVRFVRHHVERTVRSLPHIANATAAVREQVLLSAPTIVGQHEPHQTLFLQCADEETPAPGRKRITGVELRAGWGDDRIPVINRVDESGPRRD